MYWITKLHNTDTESSWCYGFLQVHNQTQDPSQKQCVNTKSRKVAEMVTSKKHLRAAVPNAPVFSKQKYTEIYWLKTTTNSSSVQALQKMLSNKMSQTGTNKYKTPQFYPEELNVPQDDEA